MFEASVVVFKSVTTGRTLVGGTRCIVCNIYNDSRLLLLQLYVVST